MRFFSVFAFLLIFHSLVWVSLLLRWQPWMVKLEQLWPWLWFFHSYTLVFLSVNITLWCSGVVEQCTKNKRGKKKSDSEAFLQARPHLLILKKCDVIFFAAAADDDDVFRPTIGATLSSHQQQRTAEREEQIDSSSYDIWPCAQRENLCWVTVNEK